MGLSTTEITSAEITSDNPIHQRLLFAYEAAIPYLKGDLLEIGCGQGRGLQILIENSNSYTAIDKIEGVLDEVSRKHENIRFLNQNVPPFNGIEDNTFDTVVSFQVIEHIENDKLFVDEIYRVLKPGGKALISTPNKLMSLTRNPWHVREYTPAELMALMRRKFQKVDMKGVYGSEIVDNYYLKNKESVEKITKYDILNLQYRLPRSILQIPYEILNRMNRNKLQKQNNELVLDITTGDYSLKPADDKCYDLFVIAEK